MKQLNLIPLGGIGNVTKNMYLYEYEGSILIVDCGIGFPDPSMLGVDLLIPDITYLKDKLSQIVGMVLTHGHDDHIAGLPYILPQLGTKFPIYGSPLTLGFAKDRLKEYGIQADFQNLPQKPIKLGPFTIDNLFMTHSVPDARHLIIQTPETTVYHGTDFKLDLNPVDGRRPDFLKIGAWGNRGIDVMLCDALNSEQVNYSLSESTLTDMFEREIRHVPGKVIITVMSSNIHRVQQAVDVAVGHNRKVAFVGRSVESNVRTAQDLGLLKLPTKHIVNIRAINKINPKNLCVIIAGSQGQTGSSLTRAASGEHKFVTINPEDKVIFASEAIPGNEQNVYATIDTLSRTGADVTYSDIDESVHVSGHSSSIEMKLLMSMLQPKHVIPIGGTYHHMIEFRRHARSLGFPDKHIHLLENGQVVEIDQGKVSTSKTIELKNIMVDGLGVGDVGNVVLRDRQQMKSDGMVAIVVPIEVQTGKIIGDIEVISRGFVYMRDAQDLIDQIKQATKDTVKSHQGIVTDWQDLRRRIEKTVLSLIVNQLNRQPLVMTVIIEV
jgi:ribonuclease J